MKALLITFCIIFCSQVYSQQPEAPTRFKDTFVRVFDSNGKKIAKGKIVNIGERTLMLKSGKSTSQTTMDKIHHIKARRSAATNVLIGAGAGAILGAIIGITYTDPDPGLFEFSRNENALLGFITGGAAGAGIGGITLLFRKGNVYHIQGSEEAWEYFRDSMAL